MCARNRTDREVILFDVDGTLIMPNSWHDDGVGQFYSGVTELLRRFYTDRIRGQDRYVLGFLTGSCLQRMKEVCERIDPRLYDDALIFAEMGLVGRLWGEEKLLFDDRDGFTTLRHRADAAFTTYQPHQVLLSLLPDEGAPLHTLEQRFFDLFPAYRGRVETSTSTEAVDITPQGFDKSCAIEYLRENGYGGIHYLGDSDGDLPAFEAILDGALGVAALVGDAAKELQEQLKRAGGTVLRARGAAAVDAFIQCAIDSASSTRLAPNADDKRF